MRLEDIKNINLFLLDMDGTIYEGSRIFEFTKEVLEKIRLSGKKYLFMTNNSSKSVSEYVKKLETLGISSVEDDFITSSQATAHFFELYHSNSKIYVCGTESLKEELRKKSLLVTEDIDEVDIVLVGYDTELTYRKLEDVSKILHTKKVLYYATHPDVVCPTEFGNVPDCGSICEMLYQATRKRPIVIGKPEALMPEIAMKKWGYSKYETAIVGDRLYTDIKCALNANVTGILVMSGETTRKILEESVDKPHIILKDCGEIIKYL